MEGLSRVPQLLTSSVLASVWVIARRRFFVKGMNAIAVALGIVFLRDLLSYFIYDPLLYAASDALIPLAYLGLVRPYTGKRTSDIVVVLLGGLLIGVMWMLPVDVRLVGLPTALVAAVYLQTSLNWVAPTNTPNAEFIVTVRPALGALFLLGTALTALLGQTSEAAHAFLYPLCYLLHLLVISRIDRFVRSSQDQLLEVAQTQNESLFSFMGNLGTALAQHLEMEQVLSLIVESATRESGASGAAALMIDGQDEALHVRATSGLFVPPYDVPGQVKNRRTATEQYVRSRAISLDDSILGDAIRTGEALLVSNVSRDERFAANHGPGVLYMSSFMGVPLTIRGRILGIIVLTQNQPDVLFNERDLSHARTFADYAALTIDILFTYMEVMEKREVDREVGIAAGIQQKLLPQRLPRVAGADIAVFSNPARGVSGDYYDAFRLTDRQLGLLMCDVAGKGIPASLVMVIINSILHLVASPRYDAKRTLSLINRGLAGRVEIDHYATLSYLIYDAAARVIDYSNAAHHPLAIYRVETGTVEEYDTPGLPIGIEPEQEYDRVRIQVHSGDLMMMYTDGVVEAMDEQGRQYGTQRLLEVFATAACSAVEPGEPGTAVSADSIAEFIRLDIAKHVDNARQHDDQTLMVVRFSEEGENGNHS